MTEYKRIGIDTSKAVFTLHGIDQQERPVLRINLRRRQLLAFFKKLPPTEVAMEACGSAHHWARELTALGHEVRLVPPQYVKPYVKRSKNDRNDAEAICEAAGRPGMHFVPVKSVTQQAQGMVLKVRETLVGRRTQMTNTLRGHAAEFGVIAGKGLRQIGPLLTAIEQETAIPAEAKDMACLLGQEIEHLDRRIKEIDVKLAAAHKANEVSQRLATSAADAFRHIGSLRDPIPGIGPITASLIAATVSDIGMFKSARHFAAWLGLVPRQHSTGGKTRLGRITKTGNREIRKLLVLGATSMVYRAPQWNSAAGLWIRGILERRPVRLATVALANKMARIAWALMTRNEVYQAKGRVAAAAA
jgi:transposase